MTFAQPTTRNRINPLTVSTVEQTAAPYVTYDEVALCTDPNCPVCRAQRRDKRHKKRHHHRHHHRKHQTNFWNNLLPRTEPVSPAISVHSIGLDDRRSYYNSHVTERAVVPVDQTERELVSTTTRSRRVGDEEIARDAWTTNRSADDEIVCCRAYNGCRCPCWCCIILIILFVILLIVLIVLLATLL